jgi:hypothetical protein
MDGGTMRRENLESPISSIIVCCGSIVHIVEKFFAKTFADLNAQS